MDNIEKIVKFLEMSYSVEFSEKGYQEIRKLGERYGDEELFNAVNIAVEQYSDCITALSKLEDILFNRSRIMNKFLL